MNETEALALIRQMLRAESETELMQIVSLNLSAVDGTFFSAAEASARQLDREGKPSAATALRGLADRMLRMKTLI